jgi:hypothetical protein
VDVAGLPMQGTPARKLGANFSSRPQTGKLKALMWTARPPRGTRMWVPAKVFFLPSGMAGPSCSRLPEGSSLAPTPAYANSVPLPPSMSIQLSVRVAPVWAEIAYSCSLRSPRNLASAFSRSARCWKSSFSRLGTPTLRACCTASAKSSFSACVLATGLPLMALRSSCAASRPTHWPPM